MKKLISILLFFLFFAAQGKEIVVPAGGSISQAVSGASSGDVVRLSEGVYTQNSVIGLPIGVDVIGAGSTKTIIKTNVGQGSGISPINRGLCVFRVIRCSNQRIGGFTIDGQNRTGYGGIVVQASNNVEVFDIEVLRTRAFAMIFDGVSNSTVQGCLTRDSGSFVKNGDSGWSWGAVMMWKLENFTYQDNEHYETKSYCIKSQSTNLTNVKFIGNTFYTLGTMSPWGKTGSENIAVELHGNYLADVVFDGNKFDNQLSIACNHRAVWQHELTIKGNRWDAPKVRAKKPDYNIELNLYSTTGKVRVYNNYGNCRSRFIGTWLQGKKAGGWKIYNNVVDNMRGSGRYSGFITGNSVIEDVEIFNNTIIHPYAEEWSLIYLDSKAQSVSKNIKIYKNLIQVADFSGSYFIRHDRRPGYSNVSVSDNVIEGFRRENKYKAGGVTSSNNIYASAQIQGFGDKPFPYYTSPLPHGAKPFEISVPDIPDVPTPGPNPEPQPVKESLIEGEIVIDTGGSDDKYYTGGTAYTGRGYNERYGEFQYNIPVSKAGRYRVSMDLTEIYHSSSGKRSFNVYAQEEVKLEGVDPWKLSNGEKLVLSFEAEVPGEELNLRFESVKDMAKVNSIGVTYLGEPKAEYHYFFREEVRYRMKDTLLRVIIPDPYTVQVRDSIKTN